MNNIFNLINFEKSLYVGDMAGRKDDYSASDLLFAMNLNINFLVPEVFYNIKNSFNICFYIINFFINNICKSYQFTECSGEFYKL